MKKFLQTYHVAVLQICGIAVIPLMFVTLLFGSLGWLATMWLTVALQIAIFVIAIYTVKVFREGALLQIDELIQREAEARARWPRAYEYLDELDRIDEFEARAIAEQREAIENERRQNHH